jgi:pilus assembly protein CpaC
MSNNAQRTLEKAPGVGDIPILGSLFRSTQFRKGETELVIVVTPYLVRPVSNQIALPTDGYRAPDDGQMVFQGQTYKGVSGSVTPTAVPAPVAPAGGAAPGFKL